MILPKFCFVSHSKCSLSTIIIQLNDTMVSCNELSRLAMGINITAGTGRPLRNIQGICCASPHTTRSTNPLLDAPSIPVNSQFTRSILTKKGTHSAPNTPNTLPSDRQVAALAPCMRQHDRFVDPSGKLLQPVTVIAKQRSALCSI